MSKLARRVQDNLRKDTQERRKNAEVSDACLVLEHVRVPVSRQHHIDVAVHVHAHRPAVFVCRHCQRPRQEDGAGLLAAKTAAEALHLRDMKPDEIHEIE